MSFEAWSLVPGPMLPAPRPAPITFTLAAALAIAACAHAPESSPPTPPPAPASDAHASEVSATRAWVAAVEAGSWERLVDLLPPERQARGRAELSRVPEARKQKVRETARKIAAAMAKGKPPFVDVEAILAEPAHREWYYCGTPPPGEVWASPCAVSVVEVNGRWYVLGVTDDER